MSEDSGANPTVVLEGTGQSRPAQEPGAPQEPQTHGGGAYSQPELERSLGEAWEGLLKPGSTLAGRYTVLEPLGQGGMGVVLAAYDSRLDRRVALKLLREQRSSQQQEQHARLLREAQAMARLSHPHVVSIYDTGSLEDGGVFIAMEYVEGQTLRTWSQEKPRPWREVLEAYVAAGRGLAAAHEAGLVHRDFKPDNVLVGRDGRVRVTDFGVARAEALPTPATPLPVPTLLSEAWDTPLTLPGMVVGTPKYLAPELLKGQPADARSDLFAYCVALYEALYGQPAFLGTSRQERMRAQLEGQVSPPPPSSEVPAWVARTVLQGLKVEPHQRPPSMQVLLEALGNDPQARRRAQLRTAALVGVPTSLVALAAGTWLYLQQQRCTSLERRLTGIWDKQAKAQVHKAFVGTGLGYAQGTFQRVEAALDAYAGQWVRLRTEVCEAGEQQAGAPQALAVRQVYCLERRRSQLQALTTLLARGPDKDLLLRAVQASHALPPLEYCADARALLAEVPPPEDPVVREQVEKVEQRLDQLAALFEAGKYREGVELGERLRPEAEAVDHAPLRARALFELARLKGEAGSSSESEALMRKAIPLAARGQDGRLASLAWSYMLLQVGSVQARHAEALSLWVGVEAAAEQTGDGLLQARALNNLGIVLWETGRFEEALERQQQALALRQKELPPEHSEVGESLNNLGVLLWEMGRFKEALALHEQALAVRTKALGPEHPDLAESLSNLGAVYNSMGQDEQSVAHHERALTLRERLLGPEHPDLATSLGNLGVSLTYLGQYERALQVSQRSLTLREKALGPEHPDLALALLNVGALLERTGRYSEAQAFLERSRAIVEKRLEPAHTMRIHLYNNLGLLMQRLGQYEQAQGWHAQAQAIAQKALGSEHVELATAFNHLGHLYMQTGRLEQARAQAARSLALCEKALGPESLCAANSLVTLGRILLRRGELSTAQAHLEHALALQHKAVGREHPRLADSLLGLGELLLARQRPAEALEPLERALKLSHGQVRAQVQLALARALWAANGDRHRARALALELQHYCQRLGHRPMLAEVSRWLATHSSP